MACFDIQAEAATDIHVSCEVAWKIVTDLTLRPTVISWQPLVGEWPAETAKARVVMDKGERNMARTETVVRSTPPARFIIRVDAEEWNVVAFLDHRLEKTANGCRLTLGVTCTVPLPTDAPPDFRTSYINGTTAALGDSVAEYRRRIEGKRS